MLDTRVRAVPHTAYTIVLRHHVAKPCVCQTSTRLCQANGWGHRSRLSVCWSDISAVRATKTNGSTKSRPRATAKECSAIHSSFFFRRRARGAAVVPSGAWEMVVMSVLRAQEAAATPHQESGERHRQHEEDE